MQALGPMLASRGTEGTGPCTLTMRSAIQAVARSSRTRTENRQHHVELCAVGTAGVRLHGSMSGGCWTDSSYEGLVCGHVEQCDQQRRDLLD